MIGRVTQMGLQRASLAHLQDNLGRMAQLQERLTTGKVITKPSDDPAGTVDAMRVRADQRATAQYMRNTADGNAWLTTIDDAMGDALTALRRGRDLVVNGASTGTQGPSSRAAIASELRATADQLFETANTSYLGRSVFAGTSTSSAFELVRNDDGTVRSYKYTGSEAGTEVLRRVSDSTEIRVDSRGDQVFGIDDVDDEGNLTLDADGEPTGMSVFTLLNHVAAKIEAGAPDVGEYLAKIDEHLSAFLSEVGSVGTRHNQIMRADEALSNRELTLESRLSAVEDADLPRTIVDLQIQEVSYQAALNATGRVLQPSLLDFLR